MSAIEATTTGRWDNTSDREWSVLSARAPQLTATVRRYLVQCSTFLAPASVDAAENTLRQFTRWVTDNDIETVAEITRTNFEDYKVWLAAQPGTKGG
jgi:site-specific recombinase XerD